jgi:hypothetical protein
MFVGPPFQIGRGRQPAGEVLRHRILEREEKGRGLRLRLHFESGVERASEVFLHVSLGRAWRAI